MRRKVWSLITSIMPGLLVWARVNAVIDFRRPVGLLFERTHRSGSRVLRLGPAKAAEWHDLGAVRSAGKAVCDSRRRGRLVLYAQNTEHPEGKRIREQPWFTPEFFRTLMAPFDCHYFAPRLAPRPGAVSVGRRDTA